VEVESAACSVLWCGPNKRMGITDTVSPPGVHLNSGFQTSLWEEESRVLWPNSAGEWYQRNREFPGGGLRLDADV
jgi:hypothetical protein